MKIAAVKKILLPLAAVLVIAPGCFLFSDFRKQEVVLNQGQPPLKLKVPRGYRKKEIITDSTGLQVLTYTYPFGPQLYFTRDTGLAWYIDTVQHFPRPHLQGGIFYKGVMPRLSIWREVYSQGLRFGYRNVSLDEEPRFDSSLNYVRTGR